MYACFTSDDVVRVILVFFGAALVSATVMLVLFKVFLWKDL